MFSSFINILILYYIVQTILNYFVFSSTFISEKQFFDYLTNSSMSIHSIQNIFIDRDNNIAQYYINETSYSIILPKQNIYHFQDKVIDKFSNEIQFYYNSSTNYLIYIKYILISYICFQLIQVIFNITLNRSSEKPENNSFNVTSIFTNKMDVHKIEKIDVKFNDVAGCIEAKREVKKFVEMLKKRDQFIQRGATLPRGILLEGPSGCGKTLLAKAIAGEAGVQFLSTTGSDFNEMFVGVGAARVKSLFDKARENSPSIIFIDEIDSIGTKRGKKHLQEHDSVLNKILTEMDGFKTTDNVIVIASTNMSHKLDKALLRSGRFDTKIIVDYPNSEEREQILDLYLSKIKLHFDDDILATNIEILITELRKNTFGLSGADIKNFINQANINSILEEKQGVTKDYLLDALDRIRIGEERRSRKVSEEELKIVAYHESGHALIGYLLKKANSPLKMSIIPRGKGALGFTQPLHNEKSLHSKQELYVKIYTLYGGRVAEELIFGEITNGASDDIQKATELMYTVYCELGMSKDLGEMRYCVDDHSNFHISEKKRYQIENLVCEEMKKIYQNTYEILDNHIKLLKCLATKLLDKETITYQEIVNIVGSDLENSIDISI